MFCLKKLYINRGPEWFLGEEMATTIQPFLESKQDTIDTNINSAGILFDLMKEYGVISKQILMTKLNNGIWYIRNLWFKSHLLCRIWFVEISKTDNKNSVQNKSNDFCREMTHVVPQGSVLGLILLLIVWE